VSAVHGEVGHSVEERVPDSAALNPLEEVQCLPADPQMAMAAPPEASPFPTSHTSDTSDWDDDMGYDANALMDLINEVSAHLGQPRLRAGNTDPHQTGLQALSQG
jgi:hypothetical protein